MDAAATIATSHLQLLVTAANAVYQGAMKDVTAGAPSVSATTLVELLQAIGAGKQALLDVSPDPDE
jgi:hypothetical protein